MEKPDPQFLNRWLGALKEIVLKHTPPQTTVFLFGSYATGHSLKSSDVDIGFLGSNPIDRKTFFKIRNEVEESIIPFPIDLVDFSTVSEEFKKIALQKTILWKQA